MADNLEKYKKVRSEREAVPDGIIRVNRTIQARNFIDHVLDEFNNKGKDSVTLSSLGQAITKAVTIAEIVKHRVAGLHQVNEINTIVIDDEYEPLEEEKEQLDKMTVSRKLTCLQITLSKTAPKDTSVAGYQPPIPESEVNPDAGPEDESRKQDNRRRRRARSATKGDKDGEKPSGTDEAKPKAAAETPSGETPAGDKPQGRGNGNRRGGNRQRAKTARPAAGATPGDATPADQNPFLDK
jgi:ribonucleases P/MRP protein subunit RPP25